MKPDDIISYSDLVREERANLQKGMNFGIGSCLFIFQISAVAQWHFKSAASD